MIGIGLLVLLTWLRNGLHRAISILGVVVSRFARTHFLEDELRQDPFEMGAKRE